MLSKIFFEEAREKTEMARRNQYSVWDLTSFRGQAESVPEKELGGKTVEK